MTESLVKIKDLEVVYTTKKNIFGGVKTIHAVNGVSLDIKKGEILAIAGESGCGKSTLAKAVMRLVNVKSGEIKLEDENILNFKNREDLKHFYQRVQMIFQNPYSSLNPKMKIGQILREPLEINTKLNRTEIDKIVEDKLAKVGLDKSTLELYPHEFSGGQRQRIAITRALVLSPEFIIADEPVSALDVRAFVYGCFGSEKISSVFPSSTISPKYIIAILSDRYFITLKSCEINRKVKLKSSFNCFSRLII